MTERYSTFTLKIKALADLSTLSTYNDAEIWDINGRQGMNAAERGSFKLYASNATLLADLEANIGQVVTVYVTDQVASGGAMDLATFIIKNIHAATGEGVSEVTVSGPEITDQLRNTNAGNNAIDDGLGGPSTTDIFDIMGYAAAGWSLTNEMATAEGTYHAARGDTVLKLLNAAAQQSGELFRLAAYADPTSKGLFWAASPDSSSVTLRMPSTHSEFDGSTTVGKLYSLRREYDFEPVITRIRPFGAGVGDGRLDITGINSGDTGPDPSWLDTTFASNLMVNTDLETALGYIIEQDVDFSWIQANDSTDFAQLDSAAVAVWKTGKNYLEQNDAAREFYTAVCNVAANLRPGQSVTVVYSEYQGGMTGGSQTININKTLTILAVENRFEEGERITTLTLGDKPLPQPTAAQWVADVAEKTQDTTRKSDVGTSPGAVSVGRTLSATLPLRIDGGPSADLSADRTLTLDGLSSYGAANQVAGVNAAATGWQYKTVTAGTGISVGHSAGVITITNTSPGGADLSGLAFVTIGNTASLSGERALVAGAGLTLSDGGANSSVTLDVGAGDGIDVAADSIAVDVTDIIGNGLVEVATNNIALGTPDSATSTSTNAVTASSHTHAVDNTIARSAITVSAGNGLTGGGDLSANRTITMGTPSTLTVSTSNGVTASSHTHAITSSSNPGAAVAILSSDTDGRLGLEGLGIGTAADGDYLKITSNGTLPAILVSAGTEGEIATPDGENIRFGHWNSGTSTFTERMQIDSGGEVSIGTDTGSPNVTVGLTIDQGGNDDTALALRDSTDVAHGMTNSVETATYGRMWKIAAATGGLRVDGYGEIANALLLRGHATGETTTRSAAGNATVEIAGYQKSGAGLGSISSSGNVVAIKNAGSTVAIFGGDGDLYLDTVVNENNWDTHDDIALLHGLRADMMPDGHELRQRFGQFIEGARGILERTGVVHYNDDGHHFVATKRLQMLTIDAVRQMYEQLDGRLAALEERYVS